jgi:hypothetical protein
LYFSFLLVGPDWSFVSLILSSWPFSFIFYILFLLTCVFHNFLSSFFAFTALSYLLGLLSCLTETS